MSSVTMFDINPTVCDFRFYWININCVDEKYKANITFYKQFRVMNCFRRKKESEVILFNVNIYIYKNV